MPFREFDTEEITRPQVSQDRFRSIEPEEQQAVVKTTVKEQPSFFGTISERLKERTAKTTEALQREQAAPSKLLQTVGQGVGFFNDVVGETLVRGVKALAPNFVEEGTRDAIKAAANSELGQKALSALNSGAEKYKEFRDENPEFAGNFEAVMNIGDTVTTVLGVGLGKKAGAKGIEVAGKALKESGEVGIEKAKTSFVRDLVSPITTKKVAGEQVERTAEVGKGLLKKKVVEPSASELRSQKYVNEIPEVSQKNTLQGNFTAIKNANKAEAESLAANLKTKDFIYPRKELMAKLNVAAENLAKNPVLTGDAQETANKLIGEIRRRIEASPSKGSELLKIRKDFDKWIEMQKGSSVFDPAKENAFSVANREIRQTINDFLDVNAPSAGVKESLKKQNALYNAMDIIRPKAAQEASTAIGRFMQRTSDILGTQNKIYQALVPIVGFGTAAAFPAVAKIGAGGFLIYKGGKLVMKPELRKGLGDLLLELNKKGAGKIAGGTVGASPALLSQTDELKKEIEQFIEDYSDESTEE